MVLLEDVGGMRCPSQMWQGGSGMLLVSNRVAIDCCYL